MNGDDVRDVGFLRRGGYDASQVDDLLRRVAMELDAGRPVGPLIANATFRWQGARGYDIEAVDWILDQLRRREDHDDLAGAGADPWRGLAVAKYFSRSGPGLAQECAAAWRDFSEVPGVQLRWVWAGAARRELRTAERQTIASCYGRSTTFSTGGRTFARKQVTGSSRPDNAEIVRRSLLESSNRHFLDASTAQAKAIKGKDGFAAHTALRLKQLVDEMGTPILYTNGRHFNGSGTANRAVCTAPG